MAWGSCVLIHTHPTNLQYTTHKQVNHYGEPGPRDSRLDFSWYEYPFERFEEVITDFNKVGPWGGRVGFWFVLCLYVDVGGEGWNEKAPSILHTTTQRLSTNHPQPPPKKPNNQFTLEFAAAHNGFRPGACATYFMQRMHDKPHGWFSRHGKGASGSCVPCVVCVGWGLGWGGRRPFLRFGFHTLRAS